MFFTSMCVLSILTEKKMYKTQSYFILNEKTKEQVVSLQKKIALKIEMVIFSLTSCWNNKGDVSWLYKKIKKIDILSGSIKPRTGSDLNYLK